MKIRPYNNELKVGLFDIYLCFRRVTERRDSIVVLLVATFQVLLSILDIVSVVLLGYASSLQFNKNLSVMPELQSLASIILPRSWVTDRAELVFFLCGLSFILLLIKTILTIVITKYLLKRFTIMHNRISLVLFNSFIRQPFPEIQKKSMSEINQIFGRGIEVLTIEIFAAVLIFFSDLVLVLFMILLLLFVDFGLSVSLVISFSVSGGIIYFRSNKLARASGVTASREVAESEELFGNTLKLYRELKTRHEIGYFQKRFGKSREKLASAIESIALIPYINKYAIEIGFIFAVLVMTLYQALFLDTNDIAYKIVVFAVAGSRLLPAVLRVQQGLFHIRSRTGLALPTIRYLENYWPVRNNQEVPVQDVKMAESVEEILEPCVTFKNVNFTFRETEFSLNNLNFEIQAGSKVAIVGESGSGKTTLVDLMLGILHPQSGDIKISFAKHKQKFQSLISYVPQETFLINGSFRENLLLDSSTQNNQEEDIMRVIEQVKLSKFFSSLQDGLETKLGANGIQISGGQRQRLGLARALLTNPQILVLDEFTSSLDSETEKVIWDVVYVNKDAQRTVITISHRYESLKDSDLIICLDNGTYVLYESWQKFHSSKHSEILNHSRAKPGELQKGYQI